MRNEMVLQQLHKTEGYKRSSKPDSKVWHDQQEAFR